MAKASPIITSFNSGEFSPLMAGRVDVKYYPAACKKLLNAIPTVQGPVRKRPGTRYVAGVKTNANRTWLKRFVFNQAQSYMLEFGNLYIRFFYADGSPIMSGGSPYEVATPFTTADLTTADGNFRLHFTQSNDVLYITSGGLYPLKKLTRLTASTFSLTDVDTVGGPFKDIDPDETITVYASARTGAGITLTASSALFAASDVGRKFYIEAKKDYSATAWEVGKAVGVGNIRMSDGKYYKAINAATTGSLKPTHTYGTRSDGAVNWEYQDPGYGYVQITAYGSSTSVTATVIDDLSDGSVTAGNASNRWAFDLFNATDGYPQDVAFHRDRLILARDLTIVGSVAGDYENFHRKDDAGLVVADMSFVIDITSEESNAIQWMRSLSTVLLAGTSGDEHAIREITTTQAFGPGNVRADKQSAHGSENIPPATVGSGIVYVQRKGRKMRDMLEAESVNVKFASANVTVLSEHITLSGLVHIAYQQEPDSIVWGVRNDGILIGFTLDREQDVKAWHPHILGGYSDAARRTHAMVECVESIPGDGYDELWMIVRRYINGGTVRYIERMQNYYSKDGDIEDAFYVDCGLPFENSINATLTPGAGATVVGTTGVTFTAGSAVFSAGDVGKYIIYHFSYYDAQGEVVWDRAIALITTYTDTTHVDATIIRAFLDLTAISANLWRMTTLNISGMDHLEGEEVQLWGEGAVYPAATVSSGAFTVPYPTSKLIGGLKYTSVVTPLPIEAAAADGTAQGKTKRISRLIARLYATVGLKYGRERSDTMDEILLRDAAGIMDQGPAAYTGDTDPLSWPDGYSTDGLMTFVHDYPGPMNIISLMPQIHTEDNR